MIRKASFGFVLLLGFVMIGFPVLAQDHSDHTGHTHAAPEPAVSQKMTMEKPVAIPEKLVDVRYKVCPIMGDETKPEFAAIFEGKVYHFCCSNCSETFKKDPKAVIPKIMDAEEVPLTITNKDGKCPVTGETANGDLYLVRGNNITFYCCDACVGKDELESDEPVVDPQKSEEK